MDKYVWFYVCVEKYFKKDEDGKHNYNRTDESGKLKINDITKKPYTDDEFDYIKKKMILELLNEDIIQIKGKDNKLTEINTNIIMNKKCPDKENMDLFGHIVSNYMKYYYDKSKSESTTTKKSTPVQPIKESSKFSKDKSFVETLTGKKTTKGEDKITTTDDKQHSLIDKINFTNEEYTLKDKDGNNITFKECFKVYLNSDKFKPKEEESLVILQEMVEKLENHYRNGSEKLKKQYKIDGKQYNIGLLLRGICDLSRLDDLYQIIKNKKIKNK